MSYERIKKYSTPNYTRGSQVYRTFGVRRDISGITIHHWGDPRTSPTFAAVVSWLCNPKSGVSAHAVIEAGRVAFLVDYSNAAWHAGNARGNATTIGLELHPRASEADYQTAAEHIADIWVAYGVIPLYPHKHWKATACPGAWNLDKLKRLASTYYAQKKKQPVQEPKPLPVTIFHKIRRGETLSSISAKYNVPVASIAKDNGIRDTNRIIAGKTLKIFIR